ncbi:MAG TPA: MmcQ/YjbR family DNA-binding protein [Thermoanaerobaculia bacterium]|nr:MmcQ/YjbR family DNA-binding protein [Thermoanaerobaculia bacterium]
MTYDTVRELGLALPGVEEGTSYGTPALKVKGKLLARLREDAESVVLVIGFDNREMLMQMNPETFYITDHYRDYPDVLVRLSTVRRGELRDALEMAWRHVTAKKAR